MEKPTPESDSDGLVSGAADTQPLSAREAAKLLEKSERTVRRAIHSGTLKATKHAGDALRAAGAPAVRRGKQIADRLTRAFQRAGRELAKAGAQAASIPTDSGSTFQLGASAVNAEIETAFRRIAAVSPGQSAQLRAAAAKQPTCQVLR